MLGDNLRRQFDLLRSIVAVGLQMQDFRLTIPVINALHAAATSLIVDSPGQFRSEYVSIMGSPHTPPDASSVQDLMVDLILKINGEWEMRAAPELAAFALWRLVWIHPYADGNGRTARALAYLLLCMKFRRWLPGKNNLMINIKSGNARYHECLRHCDTTSASGQPDLLPLASFIAELLERQLAE